MSFLFLLAFIPLFRNASRVSWLSRTIGSDSLARDIVSGGAFERHVFNLVKGILDVIFTAWIITYNIFTLCNVIFKYYI